MEQASFIILNNKDVVELEGYGKTIYQNNQETYFRGYRNRKEQDSGVGETKIVNSTDKLKSLIGMVCPYAINFLKTQHMLLQSVNLRQNKKKLSVISQ